MSNAPHFDIDIPSFWADPYPALARMRKEAPIAFVPQLGSTVFTRREDIFTQEKRTDVFSSHQPNGLMNVLMGHNMMRKDGDAHMSRAAGDVSRRIAAHGARHMDSGNFRLMPTAFSKNSLRKALPICARRWRCRCRRNA